jgi:hypothetical protein
LELCHEINTSTSGAVIVVSAVAVAPAVQSDEERLNYGVVAEMHTVQHQSDCATGVFVHPQLRLANQWNTDDVLTNRNLYGDIGSDGTTQQDRANAARFGGVVAKAAAIYPALAISGCELISGTATPPTLR